jgi:BlaI family transcriptional regulator, penicillinase repressor
MSTREIKPTEKELEILRIMWNSDANSVKDVHEKLGGSKANGYTTILKLMQIMFEKGLVTRQKSGKLHLYRAVPSQAQTQRLYLDKMIDTLFQGSAAQLVISALGNKKSTPEDLQAIKKYLNELNGGE